MEIVEVKSGSDGDGICGISEDDGAIEDTGNIETSGELQTEGTTSGASSGRDSRARPTNCDC